MPATSRAIDLATRRTQRQLADIGSELLERRLSLNISQEHVAAATRASRKHYGLIEGGRLTSLRIDELNRVAAILGLEASVRLYPAGPPVRDVGHARRLQRFIQAAQPPLVHRVEVPLPIVADRPDRRAWDAVLFRGRDRCTIELEMRLRDVQALRRRIDLKRRDDPAQSFVLLVADTRTNRQVLAAFTELFADLPRLRPSAVARALGQGRLPPSGMLLI